MDAEPPWDDALRVRGSGGDPTGRPDVAARAAPWPRDDGWLFEDDEGVATAGATGTWDEGMRPRASGAPLDHRAPSRRRQLSTAT